MSYSCGSPGKNRHENRQDYDGHERGGAWRMTSLGGIRVRLILTCIPFTSVHHYFWSCSNSLLKEDEFFTKLFEKLTHNFQYKVRALSFELFSTVKSIYFHRKTRKEKGGAIRHLIPSHHPLFLLNVVYTSTQCTRVLSFEIMMLMSVRKFIKLWKITTQEESVRRVSWCIYI